MQKKKKNSTQIFFADFETTTTEPTQVWLWALLPEHSEPYTGTTVESFVNKVIEVATKKTRIEFFNLGFDSSFFLHEFERQGFTITSKNCYGKRDKTEPLEISSCYGLVKPYCIKVVTKEGKEISFTDTMNYSGGSIRFWGEKFGFPKGDTPLLTEPPKILRQEWVDYVVRDVEIQRKVFKLFELKELCGTTTGSITLKNFKENLLKIGAGIEQCKGAYKADKPNPFKYVFNLDPEIDKLLRPGYRGGYVYCNPAYQGLNLQQTIYHYDIVSSYPTQLYYKPMPYGAPVLICRYNDVFGGNTLREKDPMYYYEKFKTTRPLYIGMFEINADFTHSYPTVLHAGEYPMKLKGEYVFTNVDIDRIKKQDPNCTIKCIWLATFKASTNMFKNYLEKLVEWKNSLDKNNPERELPKLLMNSLYGKFGSKITATRKYPHIVDGVLKYGAVTENKEGVYLPVAMFTTAYGREQLFTAIDEVGYENFCYSDTDSIFSTKPLPETWLSKELGGWDLEDVAQRATFYRPKLYKFEVDGVLHAKAAGINIDFKQQGHTYDSLGFGVGQRFTVKRSKQVKGGKIIYNNEYTIK